jgi:bifunctional DNase/RNase
MLEMQIKGLALDPTSNMPIVILEDLAKERALPIWIGIFEANAIALEMEKVSAPRPMTHDLIKNILGETQVTVSHIVVNDLDENTFFAVIMLSFDGHEVSIDSRPSDAIALALRVDAPIYVGDDIEKWKEWLDDLRPEDFGKHEM